MEPLEAWESKFGDDYTERNPNPSVEVRADALAIMLHKIDFVGDVLEVGANVGLNLEALRSFLPLGRNYHATEPNENAANQLRSVADKVFTCPAHDMPVYITARYDLVFTCGVLIHIKPDLLLKSCQEIYRTTKPNGYILCAEYFSDEPEEKEYRGEDGLLFKRDYGSFWLANFEDLFVVDCGFLWRPTTGMDNITWWLFRKAA